MGKWHHSLAKWCWAKGVIVEGSGLRQRASDFAFLIDLLVQLCMVSLDFFFPLGAAYEPPRLSCTFKVHFNSLCQQCSQVLHAFVPIE